MRARLLWLGIGLLAGLGFAQEKDQEPPPAKDTGRGLRGMGDPSGKEGVDLGTYHALLIGIDDYEHHPKLKTPLKDVAAIKKLLEEKYAFSSIRVLTNKQATRRAILKTLRELTKVLTEKDNLLIYYAGHGEQTGDAAYWIPHGGDDDLESWVSANEVRDRIDKMKTHHVLLVADSCFSGGFSRSAAPRGQDNLDTYLRRLVTLKSREILTSGGLEPVADWGPQNLSLFAYYFTQALEANDKNYLTCRELAHTVAQNVSNKSSGRQTPEHNTIQGTDDQRGQFIFAKAGAAMNVTVTGDEEIVEGPTRSLRHVPAGYSIPIGKVVTLDASAGLYRSLTDDAEMVLVWSGWFPYGGKKPKVKMAPFLIDRYEVTVERFRKFIRTQGMPPQPILHWNQRDYSSKDQPVVGVNIDHARRFAKWAGKMLPTEVEWEYAAAWDREKQRHRPYPWGDRFDAITIRRATRPPPVSLALEIGDLSPSGVCGMGSGVREWCEPAERDGSAPTIRGATQFRLGRKSYIDLATTASQPTRVSHRSHDVGFRCIIYLTR